MSNKLLAALFFIAMLLLTARELIFNRYELYHSENNAIYRYDKITQDICFLVISNPEDDSYKCDTFLKTSDWQKKQKLRIQKELSEAQERLKDTPVNIDEASKRRSFDKYFPKEIGASVNNK